MKNEALYNYLLRLGDDSLILGQRLAEWCGHGPILEEDIAMTNISLDLIGQAMNIFDYAAEIEGNGSDHDKIAMLRYEQQYVNTLLVEQPNKDFAFTMVRQFIFDAFRKPLYELMQNSKDKQLSAIAEKSLKETKYHLKHSSEWVIRMGDGTEESHNRAQKAVDDLWRYADELFFQDDVEKSLMENGILPNYDEVKQAWQQTVEAVMNEATLQIPTNGWTFGGGRIGRHSEHMGFILVELQYMQRAYPNLQW